MWLVTHKYSEKKCERCSSVNLSVHIERENGTMNYNTVSFFILFFFFFINETRVVGECYTICHFVAVFFD